MLKTFVVGAEDVGRVRLALQIDPHDGAIAGRVLNVGRYAS